MYFSTGESLFVAMMHKHGQNVFLLSVQNYVDIVVASYILYLSAAKVIFPGQQLGISMAQVGNHALPDERPSLY
jgi:O-glycosyl hydrolase